MRLRFNYCASDKNNLEENLIKLHCHSNPSESLSLLCPFLLLLFFFHMPNILNPPVLVSCLSTKLLGDLIIYFSGTRVSSKLETKMNEEESVS